MITAELKRLHSPDVMDLRQYVPDDRNNFGFLLQIMAAPKGEAGEESFDVVVCTPTWLIENLGEDGILIGRHHLVIDRYDYSKLQKYIASYCSKCTGATWSEAAIRLGRLGKWEFEDYK
jgi:hypothetical protein